MTKTFNRPATIDIAEYARSIWRVNAQTGTSIEDILNPMYWSHVARKLKPYDQIEILEGEGKWWARCLVVEVDEKWAKVHLLEKHDLAAATPSWTKIDDYSIVLRGPKLWSVVRKADSALIRDGFKTRREAEAYRDSEIKSLAAA